MIKTWSDSMSLAAGCPFSCRKDTDSSTCERLAFVVVGNRFTVRIANDIAAIEPEWKQLAGDDLFTHPDFLSVFETAGPARITPYYLLIFQDDQPVIGAIGCTMPFEAARNINLPAGGDTWWQRQVNRVRTGLARLINQRVFTIGQLWLTGEHAIVFDEDRIPTSHVGSVLAEGLHVAAQELRRQGIAIHATMFKDIDPHRSDWVANWRQQGYHPMRFEPNMVLALDPSWQHTEDYLAALHSKARVRVRRARKKLAGLYRFPLEAVELAQLAPRMHELYQDIAQRADFNLFFLQPGYFQELHRRLGDAFRCYGYFRQDELVGFYTTIQNGDELEAHFLGLDQQVNVEHHLYHNILLDILEEGIENGAKAVIYARTAPEIKSSIGAQPEDYDLYLRAQNPLINKLIPPFVEWLAPRTEWQPRHPFRKA